MQLQLNNLGLASSAMNSLADRVSEALRESGIDAQKAAKACGVSVQAVYKWTNGLSKTISGANLIELADITKFEPRWIATGKGVKQTDERRHLVKEPEAKYGTVDQVVTDLAELEPEDAAVWRAQIRAAAIKARKHRQEMKDQSPSSGACDPPPVGRRTA